MKYFLHIDTYIVYAVPVKYHYCIDIINSKNSTDLEVQEAINTIVDNCNARLMLDAMSQTL